MDATFTTDNGKFNYRVAAIIVDKKRLLVTHRDGDPYFHLPGGRVKVGETVEQAIIRELKEELHIAAKIKNPLWFNQAFFKDDNGEDFHEICVYFLMDISATPLLNFGDRFTTVEEDKLHKYQWLTFEEVENIRLYPSFLKDEIKCLPKTFSIRVEDQE
jgi:8-oxo-dGTP pyrophosphatase MutT (NUDIX family)